MIYLPIRDPMPWMRSVVKTLMYTMRLLFLIC